jgi:phosphatidylserine/phosphatidylglycerophosphate/cardiolipin synthase-like enzyme
MNNKFVVFDARSEDPLKPVVWTGSANFTDVQINLDPNNVIVIQDQSLAIAYQMEFNEMYGTDGRLPNPLVARFGPDKSNNTPHEFVIGGKRVECYFSPSDGAGEHILSSISSADFTIEVATILITILEMGEALLVRHTQGCDVKVLVNDRNPFGEPVLGILLPVLQENVRLNGEPGLMHHKYMIVDQGYAGMDPILLTGSHNWNGNAEVVNDENTLIIHDQGVANAYYQEFVNRFGAGQLLVSAENTAGRARGGAPLQVFPNPSQDWIRFSLDPGDEPLRTALVDAAGRIVREIPPEARTADLRDLPEGVYYLMVMVNSGTPLIQKVLVVR